MKKFLTLLMVAIMAVSLLACGKKESNITPTNTPSKTPTNTPSEKKDITPDMVEKAIAAALGTGYLSTVDVPSEEMFMSVLAGADMTKIESYVAKVAVVSAVDLDTIVVAKAKDGYADELVALINENYSRTIDYIRQYPFGVSKVEGARLYKTGDIVIFIIGGANADENASGEDEAKLAVAEYEKIDNAIKSLFGTLPKNLAEVKECYRCPKAPFR